VESGTCPAQTNIEKRRRKKGFFHASVSPNPLSITLGPFQIFPKFMEIIAALDSMSVSLKPVAIGKNLQSEIFKLFCLDIFG
jgi:hypothetical protein